MIFCNFIKDNGRIIKKLRKFCGYFAERTSKQPNSDDFSSYKEIVTIKTKHRMTKRKNQKKVETQAKKSAVETLRSQAHWGLKQLGPEDGNLFHLLVDAEVDFIAELNLAQDILAIKSLIDGAKQSFAVTPTPENGNFVKSPTAVSLGIASIEDINNIGIPLNWSEMIEHKLLTIYYPEEYRNQIIDWAKSNGYNTSTYRGRPIIKFSKLYIIIERTHA